MLFGTQAQVGSQREVSLDSGASTLMSLVLQGPLGLGFIFPRLQLPRRLHCWGWDTALPSHSPKKGKLALVGVLDSLCKLFNSHLQVGTWDPVPPPGHFVPYSTPSVEWMRQPPAIPPGTFPFPSLNFNSLHFLAFGEPPHTCREWLPRCLLGMHAAHTLFLALH